jgi:hypothetical protein
MLYPALILIAFLVMFSYFVSNKEIDDIYKIAALIFLAVIFIFFIFIYVYFLCKDPNKLHSEGHIYEMSKLKKLGSANSEKSIELDGSKYKKLEDGVGATTTDKSE